MLTLLVREPGATYLMDRAYVDFRRLYKLHQAGACFVTRAKKNSYTHRSIRQDFQTLAYQALVA